MKMIYTLFFLLLTSRSMMSLPFEASTVIHDFKIENGMMHWTTSKEVDNKEFIIESSIDGQQWTVVDHLEGEQYSDIDREYRYQLQKPEETTYYRLQREDMEGNTETYNKVVVYEVLEESPFINYRVKNNIVKFKTNDGNINVMILDAEGHEEYQGHTKNGGQLPLERGVYFIKLTSAHRHLFEQVIIK